MSSERRTAVAIGVAVFLSGAVLLGLEITASRVLAPTFGSSLYVWGSLIGIVLTGLAIGYWAGGALADRMPTPYLLVAALGLGAVLVALVPVLDDTILTWIVDWDPGPRLDPLLAAALLFGPASVVLASASPIAVRLAANSLERLGRTAGRLFSISTAGSIFGTFVTAFWLVPELGTDQVIAIGAVTLVAAALVVALSVRLVPAAVVLAGALAGAVALAISVAPDGQQTLSGAATKNWSPLYRLRENHTPGKLDPAAVGEIGGEFTVREARDTQYHRLFVVDDSDSRYLRFDSSFQSGMWLDDHYQDAVRVHGLPRPRRRPPPVGEERPLHRPRRRLGAEADVPRLSAAADAGGRARPRGREGRLPLVRAPARPRLKVDVDDGRRWLTRHDGRWDVIVIDAFYADSIPFHLATHEFLRGRARAARAGRRRRRQHHRRPRRGQLAAAALDHEDVPLGRSRPCSCTRSSRPPGTRIRPTSGT